MSPNKVFTFIIRGGSAFQVILHDRLGPRHTHDGRLSVWKLVGTKEDAKVVEDIITECFEGADVQCLTEEEDEEMSKARFEGEF